MQEKFGNILLLSLRQICTKISKVHYFLGHKMRLLQIMRKNIRHEEQGNKNLITN